MLRIAFSSAATSLVKVWRIRAWLSKSMTSMTSSRRILFANPIAASCAVARRSFMLALVSRSTASAIGCWTREKNVIACLAPSSKTSKSASVEVADVAWRRP